MGTALCGIALTHSLAEEADSRPAKGIQDNACIVEEAYNQEPGVVQHIGCLRRQRGDWAFDFTQEWPIGSQTHQFSYSVPHSWLRSERAQGFGDLALSYRFQALAESPVLPAFAPRISVTLPSGDSARGLGSGSPGYEVLLPFSKIVSDRVTLHANAGVSSYFNVAGRQPKNYVMGASAIYAVTRDFNLLLEVLREWEETVGPAREIERMASFTLSPGFRRAFNLAAGQIVVGAGMPVRFASGAPDFGVFLYLSFEHSFLRRGAPDEPRQIPALVRP